MNAKDLSIGYAKGLKERFQERGYDLSYDDIQKAYFLGYDTALKNIESSSRIMPRTLTAENGAKALLSGEFFERVEVNYENEDGEQTEVIKVPVTWSTIKDIYRKIVNHYGA